MTKPTSRTGSTYVLPTYHNFLSRRRFLFAEPINIWIAGIRKRVLFCLFNFFSFFFLFFQNVFICFIERCWFFFNKQVIMKNLKINSGPNIKVCSDMSYFYASRMKLCLSKQAGSLFLESLFINLFIYLLFLKGIQSKRLDYMQTIATFGI